MKNRSRKISAWAAVAGAILAVAGCAGKAIVPTSYNTYNSKDGAFQIQYPAGWDADGGDTREYAWAKFTSGGAKIYVDANSVGSLMGDIAGRRTMHVGGEVVTVDEEHAPVAKVHEQEKQGFEDDEGVSEQKPAVVKTGFSDARKSEFTGSKTFGGAFRGCRVTALSNTKRIRVVCECPESEWEALKPAFDKAIESVGMGKPQPL